MTTFRHPCTHTSASTATSTAGRVRRRSLAALACGLGLAGLAGLAGCGGGDSGGGQVPIFEFIFNATATANNLTYQVQATFNPARPTTSAGSFASVSFDVTDPNGGSTNYPGTGTWSGCTMTVDVATAAAPLAPHYTGRFSNRDTIVLTPVAPSSMPVLTLARSNPEPTDFGC